LKPTPFAAPSILIASLQAVGVEFIDENSAAKMKRKPALRFQIESWAKRRNDKPLGSDSPPDRICTEGQS
jgi:hypothetical protein